MIVKNFIEDFRKRAMNSIELSFRNADQKMPIGSSKCGGKPDLPEDFQWPYYEGADLDGKIKNRPLSFLLQINCAEIKKYDIDNKLPETGMLYFFYELKTMTWGYDPQDKGSAKVYYFDVKAETLKEKDFPEDMPKEYRLPEINFVLRAKKDVPYFEEVDGTIDMQICEQYDEQRQTFLGLEDDDIEESKLLGYADLIQGEMLFECEAVTNGYNMGDKLEIDEQTRQKLEENSKDWTLLLQLDTIADDKFLFMFGDCGRIFFYIKQDDLANRNFENVWLILQSF
ncbi:MAG: DUF1963 domain-containing protein [Endomicrobium sp.]|nr:DUF1963 domain-containing protein [Endomicrobium sp.]